MFDILTLPDGTRVGTGLHTPQRKVSAFATYEDAGPMISSDDILAAAKSGEFAGARKFDKKYIKNQKSHGSCNGFAEAIALEKARVRRGLDWVRLSGAYAYSLINDGVDQGSLLERGMRAAAERGIATEDTVRWNQIYPTLYDKAKADAEAEQYKAFECYAIRSENGVYSALVSNFDIVVAVHADNGFMGIDSKGIAGGGNGSGNHAVSADGISWDGEIIVDGVNSWGIEYGNDGRMGLTWKRHLRNTTPYHMFYAIRSTLDGRRETEPPVASV